MREQQRSGTQIARIKNCSATRVQVAASVRDCVARFTRPDMRVCVRGSNQKNIFLGLTILYTCSSSISELDRIFFNVSFACLQNRRMKGERFFFSLCVLISFFPLYLFLSSPCYFRSILVSFSIHLSIFFSPEVNKYMFIVR